MYNQSDWIIKELSGSSFGDSRLDSRLLRITESFYNAPELSIPSSCNGWGETKAAYRFFDNEKVTAEKILSPHIEATLKRVSGEKIVLMVQDTTLVNYSHREEKVDGLGHLFRESDQGFLLHPTIAVTPDRRCLGVVHNHCWVRTKLGVRHDFNKKTASEKETQRWLDSYRLSNEIGKNNPGISVINIADREADVYEFFMETLGNLESDNNADWIVRSAYNRKLENSKKPEHLLWNKLRACEVVREISFELPNHRKHDRKTSKVTQEIRVLRVSLKPCKGIKMRDLKPVDVTAVLCTEKDTPEGAKPIEWLLLTSIKLNKEITPEVIVQYYLCRWQIELYFKTLKSGCNIQALQLDSYKKLNACISLYMIIAWRIMFITMMSRNAPNMPCTILMSDEEWKTAFILLNRKPPPEKIPKLYEMTRTIGKLGGFLGRKSDGEPGIKAIWIGMNKVRQALIITNNLMDSNHETI